MPFVLIRGGGDLASGVAFRLHRCGIQCLITELPEPLSVRRLVSFSTAVTAGSITIEGVTGQLVNTREDALRVMKAGDIPVMVDPFLLETICLEPVIVVDARMLKRFESDERIKPSQIIGLGPGFDAGVNCRVVIETNRGPALGRVIWLGSSEPDTGLPEQVLKQVETRVLRAPVEGVLETRHEIKDKVVGGEIIAMVAGKEIRAIFSGVIRGLLPDGTRVTSGMKVGDVDPRGKVELAEQISEKSLAIGGGVLEALLSDPKLRRALLAV